MKEQRETSKEKEDQLKSGNPKTFKGYEEAAKIDDIFNRLLQENPITKDNYFEWLKLTRTVKTTTTIIERAFCRSFFFRKTKDE